MRIALIQLLLFINLLPGFLFSQELNKDINRKENSIIITGGPSLSMFLNLHPNNYGQNYDKGMPGFYIGSIIELSLSNLLAIQPGINYSFAILDIKYNYLSPSATWVYADYNISHSVVNFSLAPKFSIGNKRNLYIISGFYYNLSLNSPRKGTIEVQRRPPPYPPQPRITETYSNNEIESIVKNSYGILGGFGIDFPFKTNRLGIEIRLKTDLCDMGSISTDFDNYYLSNYRETSVSIGIVYKWKFKRKDQASENNSFED